MTLYDIADELIAIQKALEDSPELADEAIKEYLSSYGGTLADKVDGYCSLIRNFEAMAAVRAEEAKRMSELARADMNKAERLKATLLWFMKDVAGCNSLNTNRFRVTVAANGGKPPLVVPEDPNEWPSEFVREKVVVELDKQSLRNAIAEGKEVPGCYIAERGFHLSIR